MSVTRRDTHNSYLRADNSKFTPPEETVEPTQGTTLSNQGGRADIQLCSQARNQPYDRGLLSLWLLSSWRLDLPAFEP